MSAPGELGRAGDALGTPGRIEHADWQVPAFLVDELAPMRARWAVCIPVLNEDGRIRAQLERMRPFVNGDGATKLDALIADGGSTDGSVAPEHLRSTVVRALLTKTGPGRLSAQLRMGLAWAMEQGYDGVVCVDGNDKDDPEALPRFVAELERGADHVQGSRYVRGGRGENTPLLRHLGVKLVHAPLISFAARRRYTDTTNGFRAYSRRFLLDPRVQPFRDVFEGYELHYYLAIRAARLGFDVSEVPVVRRYPARGKTPTKISPLAGNLRVLRALFRAVAGRYDPPAA